MAKAVFYTHVANQAQFICRLVATLLERVTHPILILEPNPTQLSNLDNLLWTYNNNTFIAHEILTPNTPKHCPIILSNEIPTDSYYSFEILINLDTQLHLLANCSHIIEIISPNNEDLSYARKRFSQYRQAGFEITHHNIQGKA